MKPTSQPFKSNDVSRGAGITYQEEHRNLGISSARLDRHQHVTEISGLGSLPVTEVCRSFQEAEPEPIVVGGGARLR